MPVHNTPKHQAEREHWSCSGVNHVPAPFKAEGKIGIKPSLAPWICGHTFREERFGPLVVNTVKYDVAATESCLDVRQLPFTRSRQSSR